LARSASDKNRRTHFFECVSAEKLELAQLVASACQAEPVIALDPQIVGP
jgi:hypothetical protein